MAGSPPGNITVSEPFSLVGQTDGACSVIVIYWPGQSEQGHVHVIRGWGDCVILMNDDLWNSNEFTTIVKVPVNVSNSHWIPGGDMRYNYKHGHNKWLKAHFMVNDTDTYYDWIHLHNYTKSLPICICVAVCYSGPWYLLLNFLCMSVHNIFTYMLTTFLMVIK